MDDELIRKKLADRNLAKVAAKIGVTRAYLSQFMNGRTMGEKTKNKLIAYLLEQ